jgi:hypothetical protein
MSIEIHIKISSVDMEHPFTYTKNVNNTGLQSRDNDAAKQS